MIPLLVQLLAVLAAMAVTRAVVARAGVQLDLPQATAVALLAFLAIVGASNIRNNWKLLDVQRGKHAHTPRAEARSACTQIGMDTDFLGFVGSRVPVGERFYMDAPPLVGTGDLCVRMLLLPRQQVNDPDDARYLIFWGHVQPDLIASAKRRGGTVATHHPDHLVVRLP